MQPLLVIMAAGMGSRYGGSKQIDPISKEGDIIMDFSLFDAYRAGFRRVVFIIKEDFEEAFRQHVGERAGKVYETHFVHQELTDLPAGYAVPEGRTKPWGTAHAVLAARDVIDAPFAVLNADDYYGPEAFRLIYEYLTSKADATHHCMVGFSIENTLSDNGTVSRGICRAAEGMLTDIEEHTEVGYREDGKIHGKDISGTDRVIPEGSPVSMNLLGFGTAFVQVMKERFTESLDRVLEENPMKGEIYLPSMLNDELQNNRASMQVLHSGDKWYGITYREDRESVVNALAKMKQQGIYPQDLWNKGE